MSVVDVDRLADIAEIEFADIVVNAVVPGINKLRIFVNDGSLIDVWFSLKLNQRYSYHWERRAIDGTIYRHDNAPHLQWKSVTTFPKHFHDGSERNVLESHINDVPEQGLREFLTFVRSKLKTLAATP